MSNHNPHISVVITFHNEQVLANYSLLNIERLRQHAKANAIDIELIMVLDNSDQLTKAIVQQHSTITKQDKIIEVSYGDPGLSRNAGIQNARADYIAILDGDDYYSKNWLTSAYKTALANNNSVVHPEYSFSFGTVHCISKTLDMKKEQLNKTSTLFINYWVVTSFALKEIYLNIPYQSTQSSKTGFGHEDWHWNLEIIAAGFNHINAPETALFYRRKVTSILTQSSANNAIIRSTSLLKLPALSI